MPPLSADDCRWLVGPAGADALSLAAQGSEAAALSRALGAVRARLVADQWLLRERARQKFRQPEQMFFTARGLEQSTDQWIAEYKAARFSPGALADLCTGIGGDLCALAARCGRATLVDSDPALAILAAANVRALAPEALLDVRSVPVETVEPRDFAQWHADPDRRPGGRRVTHILHTEPPASVFELWMTRTSGGALKLAPAAQVPEAWSAAGEREWISRDRECRQQVLWWGELAHDAGRCRATKIVRSTEAAAPPQYATLLGEPGLPLAPAASVLRYVLEPDPAVLAADLCGALAARHALASVDPRVAYLTGDALVSDPLLSAFEVTDVLPLDRKKLRRLLADRGIGQLEIKQRSAGIDPAQLRRDLRLRGSHSATLLIARLGRRVTAILAQRV